MSTQTQLTYLPRPSALAELGASLPRHQEKGKQTECDAEIESESAVHTHLDLEQSVKKMSDETKHHHQSF